VHISTQAGVVNAETACALYELGARRVILARELTLEEIAQVRQNTPAGLALECFVHGSMCVSYSGRCLLSNYFAGRDANGGRCAQPCRWRYALMEETRPGEYLPVEETAAGTHIMHSKDLCMLPHLRALLDVGVDSLKIEGRAKAAYYVALVTNAYRTALDCLAQGRPVPGWVLAEPYKLSHRDYCTGFYFNAPNQAAQINFTGGYARPWDIVGIVENYHNGVCTAVQRGRAFAGEVLEALQPGRAPAPVPLQQLRDEAGQPLDATRHPEMRFTFVCETALAPGAVLRRQNT
jgi:putative protease